MDYNHQHHHNITKYYFDEKRKRLDYYVHIIRTLPNTRELEVNRKTKKKKKIILKNIKPKSQTCNYMYKCSKGIKQQQEHLNY